MVSGSPSRVSPQLLNGRTLIGPAYIFTSPETGVLKVEYWLDNPAHTGTPTRTETTAPYDFVGGTAAGATAFDTTTLSDGTHTITQVVTRLAGGGTEVDTATFTVANTPPAPNLLSVNPHVEPAPDWYVFSRIGTNLNPSSCCSVQDTDSVVLHNDGSSPVTVTALSLTGVWQFNPLPSLPAVIPAGGNLLVPLRFVAVAPPIVHRGTLHVVSNDTVRGSFDVTLSGMWMASQGGAGEPPLQDVIDAFGYAIDAVYPGQPVGGNGTVQTTGDEVLSKFWEAADPSQPVMVREIAATNGFNPIGVSWYLRDAVGVTCSNGVTQDPTTGCMRIITTLGEGQTCTRDPITNVRTCVTTRLSEHQRVYPRVLLEDGMTHVAGRRILHAWGAVRLGDPRRVERRHPQRHGRRRRPRVRRGRGCLWPPHAVLPRARQRRTAASEHLAGRLREPWRQLRLPGHAARRHEHAAGHRLSTGLSRTGAAAGRRPRPARRRTHRSPWRTGATCARAGRGQGPPT